MTRTKKITLTVVTIVIIIMLLTLCQPSEPKPLDEQAAFDAPTVQAVEPIKEVVKPVKLRPVIKKHYKKQIAISSPDIFEVPLVIESPPILVRPAPVFVKITATLRPRPRSAHIKIVPWPLASNKTFRHQSLSGNMTPASDLTLFGGVSTTSSSVVELHAASVDLGYDLIKAGNFVSGAGAGIDVMTLKADALKGSAEAAVAPFIFSKFENENLYGEASIKRGLGRGITSTAIKVEMGYKAYKTISYDLILGPFYINQTVHAPDGITCDSHAFGLFGGASL